MTLDRDEAFKILDRALAFSGADEAEAILSGGRRGSLRFARNTPTSSGEVVHASATITCVYGSRSGTVSTTQLDDDALRTAVRRAEEIAQVAPENPEYMPLLGPQDFRETPAWDEATASRGPIDRAGIAGDAIARAKAVGLTVAGYLEDNASWSARGTSHGLRAFHRSTESEYTVTARSSAGASGWAGHAAHRSDAVDGGAVTARAVEKALRSADPVELPAKPYTTILEPTPAADLVAWLLWSLDRREADEGRSALSGVPLGEPFLSDCVTLVSDPGDARVPTRSWDVEGRPIARTTWVEGGKLRNLGVSRFWAAKHGISEVSFARNVVMGGGTASLDDLVASTEYGLLVTSFWYIRKLERKKLVLTGLTRDGLFLIEKGVVTRPVINFRWNDSPIRVLQNVEALSVSALALSRATGMPSVVPAIKVRDFQFASVSPSS